MAQELRRADPSGAVLVVGRRGGVAEGLVTDAGFELTTLRVSGLDVSSPASAARFGLELPGAVLAAARVIREFRADVVIGGAGYVSVPVVLAAGLLRIPVALLEQNALPGRATRLLARRACFVATSYAETGRHLKGARATLTGNPVRAEVLAITPRGLGDCCEHLLVMGGSQGARRINRAVAGCVGDLLRAHPRLRITHQTGALDAEEMEAAAAALPDGVRDRWRVQPFIVDVGNAISEADLVLMRAGGSSIAECTALGRPMILVPYPHAGDHQRFNAAPLAAAGAARVIPDQECDPRRVAAEVTSLIDDPSTWHAMARASAGHGRRDAAERIVDLLRELRRAGVAA